MKVVIAGSSGLIGSALVEGLREHGHTVTRLVRRSPRSAEEVSWNPGRGQLPASALEGADAVVNLAGAGIGDRRWSEEYKTTLRASRVDSTTTLAKAIAQQAPGITLLQGSATGYYGNDNGNRVLTERSPAGDDFLAGLCVDWEAAAQPAVQAGARVVYLRTGLVMNPKGGSFGRLRPLFKAGLAGRLGDGSMWWSWITLPDHVGAMMFLLDEERCGALSGPVNLTSPSPETNATITAALGSAMHRPTVLPVPAAALRIALGELSGDVLGSARVVPQVLQDAGYTFTHADLASAAEWFA